MKVKFTARGGWGHEQEEAKKLLVLGEYYDVDAIVIDKWKTYLTLRTGVVLTIVYLSMMRFLKKLLELVNIQVTMLQFLYGFDNLVTLS